MESVREQQRRLIESIRADTETMERQRREIVKQMCQVRVLSGFSGVKQVDWFHQPATGYRIIRGGSCHGQSVVRSVSSAA